MIKLLVIADDITGALDTGVKFAGRGVSTRLTIGAPESWADMPPADVLVVCLSTRHISRDEAYRLVYDVVKDAAQAGVSYLYKKTDSALRGNIGGELTAMLDASGARELTFMPAFPDTGRTTEAGVQRLYGRPIQETEFGRDLFEPIRHSYVPDIVREQSDVACLVVPAGREAPTPDDKAIVVYDAATNDDIRGTTARLFQENRLRAMAGCAGFASALAEILPFSATPETAQMREGALLVVCGSVNPISLRQLECAGAHGAEIATLDFTARLDGGASVSDAQIDEWARVLTGRGMLIVHTGDADGAKTFLRYATEAGYQMARLRETVSDSLGAVAARLAARARPERLMVIGGDTLLAVLGHMGIHSVRPMREIEPGTVLSEYDDHGEPMQILSKSGGFGEEELLVRLAGRHTTAGGEL